MEELRRSDYPQERIQRLFSGVPFFNEVLRADQQQFDLLMDRCGLLSAQPGEVVIREGESDHSLYFLLRGQLAVMAPGGGAEGEEEERRVLNHISPGEVLGMLSMLRGTPRTATLQVDASGGEAILARLHFDDFSNAQDFSVFSMETQLAFYRMVVHNIRWTLEVNRMQDPMHALVGELRKVPLYTGPRGTGEELQALNDQAHALADLLCRWNEYSSAPEDARGTAD